MRIIIFKEFISNASLYLTEVEKGETIRIIRHGKIIAEICPPSGESNVIPLWKARGQRLIAKGKTLSSAIIKEREND